MIFPKHAAAIFISLASVYAAPAGEALPDSGIHDYTVDQQAMYEDYLEAANGIPTHTKKEIIEKDHNFRNFARREVINVDELKSDGHAFNILLIDEYPHDISADCWLPTKHGERMGEVTKAFQCASRNIDYLRVTCLGLSKSEESKSEEKECRINPIADKFKERPQLGWRNKQKPYNGVVQNFMVEKRFLKFDNAETSEVPFLNMLRSWTGMPFV